ncbi:MAG: ATP12 family protein [Pseudomonadota bacterium]
MINNNDKRLLKRFYTTVTFEKTEIGYKILLDAKPVKTPSKAILAVPTQSLAEYVANEWKQQNQHIEPSKMIATKLANTAIDRVAQRTNEIIQEITQYAASDMICYRADGPQDLAERQNKAWDPTLTWLQNAHNLTFQKATGVMFIEQSEHDLNGIRHLLSKYNAFELCALHNITTLTGSAFLALGYAERQHTLDQIWSAAYIDEDWQMEQWGKDEDALKTRDIKWKELKATCRFFDLSAANNIPA